MLYGTVQYSTVLTYEYSRFPKLLDRVSVKD